ncbi:hypothetical protein [Martelella alba]|uniref:Uncharacterized protein n=1 Tax=Martelella alba TaxID=2590451 RepID=A0ABY2SQN7_9HYPH|nr:hypothetical protein [Martelella alba]TKI08534.1 hypothetical protein FCN80_00255 [Martelella alba]
MNVSNKGSAIASHGSGASFNSASQNWRGGGYGGQANGLVANSSPGMSASCATGIGIGAIGGVISGVSGGPGGMARGALGGAIAGMGNCFGAESNANGASRVAK